MMGHVDNVKLFAIYSGLQNRVLIAQRALHFIPWQTSSFYCPLSRYETFSHAAGTTRKRLARI